MKVALLGATGFVGSALLKELRERGHEVTAIVRHADAIEAGNADFNPRDHSDHRATGRLAVSIAADGGFSLSQYAGYSTSEWPSDLSAAQFAEKAGLFMAYDRARILVNPVWSAYAELPAGYSSWLSRTYVRPAGFTGRSR